MAVRKEILRKIRNIEIHTRRLMRGTMTGDSRSAMKGTGFEFDQIREYNPGDDIRFMDWSATARSNKMLVRQYMEERNRTILLALDVSGSSFFGSCETRKYDVMAQVASVLALVAISGSDSVGLVMFSDKIEKFIPPSKGHPHGVRIMEEIFSYEYKPKKTNLNVPLKHLAKIKPKNAVVFMVSDFFGTLDESLLKAISAAYDMVLVRYRDKNEITFPSCGYLEVEDIESGKMATLKTSGRSGDKIRDTISSFMSSLDRTLIRCGVDRLEVTDHNALVGDVVRFFRRRMRY